MILTNKTLNFSCVENINNHAKNYKRNYKICQKLYDQPSEEASIQFKNETTPLLIENKEPYNPLREEILNWFFSLPLETRFKVLTVENSWVINMIHQMYVYYKQDSNASFEFLSDRTSDKPEAEILSYQIYFANSSLTNENIPEKEIHDNLTNYFSIKNTKREKHDLYITTMFLKETRFFSVHTNIDCLSLSPKILDDRDLFLHYFKTFSKEKFLMKLIEVVQDPKTKYYTFGFPKWIEKDFHQIASFIIAFLEQSLVIKFILNYNNKNKEKLITSLYNEQTFSEFFKLRKEMIFFLSENYPNTKNNISNSNTTEKNNISLSVNFSHGYCSHNVSNFNVKNEKIEKFIKNINVKKIYQKLKSDKNLIESIKMKNQSVDKNYNELFNRKLNSQDPLFEGVNEEDTEKKIFKLYLNEEIIIFVDNLIFTKIDSVWRLDFYIGIELFEAIHNLYTDKNAQDLIKEFEEGNENNSSKKSKKSKNKKNKQPEVTLRDFEKMNFNYYKPYMHKDNLILYNKLALENSTNFQNKITVSNLSNLNTNSNISNLTNTKESSINNCSTINTNSISKIEKLNKENIDDNFIYNNIDDKSSISKTNSIENKEAEESLKIEQTADILIFCNKIVDNIIDVAVKTGNNKNNIYMGQIKTLDDVLENLHKINKKSRDINELLLNTNPNANCRILNNEDINESKKENNKAVPNNKLEIENVYDIELGINQNSRKENMNNQSSSKIKNNNFIIENHQISIENTKTSIANFSNNGHKNSISNNKRSQSFSKDELKRKNEDEQSSEYHITDPRSTNIDRENDYFKDKALICQENFNNDSNSINKKNNRIFSHEKNENNNQFNISGSDSENFANINNYKRNKEKTSSASPQSRIEDDDAENYKKDKKKKNKKNKVQKFYQINMEKLNKKKNNQNNKIDNIYTNNNTTNKSTQTQVQIPKEINSLNLNLNINNNQSIKNTTNKKYDKKSGNSKNIPNNSNYSLTNVNINNNLNISNVKASNNYSSNNAKSNQQTKEYSKYDYPQGNKRNSFNKATNNNHYNLNGMKNSESPSNDKNCGKFKNIANIINSNILSSKDFNYSYSFNNGKNCKDSSNYNINFNYDLNYDFNNGNNYYGSRKSNNSSESKLSGPMGVNYYDSSKNSSSSNNNSKASNSFNLTKPNNNEFLAYVFKLHYDIVGYHNSVMDIVNALKDIKVNVISYIEKLLKQFIDYELSLDVFGSFASDLSIESSDIDLKVNILNQDSINIDYEEVIFNLVKKFTALNIFDIVMPIHTASVPIIKLVNFF